MLMSALRAGAQAIVADPTAVTQRTILAMESMGEAVNQTYTMSDHLAAAQEYLDLAREQADKLKEVSEFIETATEVGEITEASLRIAEKLAVYQDRIYSLSNMAEEEKYWIIDMSAEIASKAAGQVNEAMKFAKDGKSNGEFTDYERLQLIRQIREQVLLLESDLDELYDRACGYDSYTGLMSAFQSYGLSASTFSN